MSPSSDRLDQAGPHDDTRSAQAAPSEQYSLFTAEPNRPRCGGAMVCRMVKSGANAGSEFRGIAPGMP